MLCELARRVRGLREILLRQFPQAYLSIDRHEDVDHERDQRLIGAYVRRSLLAPNVLLARGERENKSALALLVDGLADQASWHLADIFFPSGYHATVRATKAKRHAERLRFHGDDVGLPWGLHNAKRNGLGDR